MPISPDWYALASSLVGALIGGLFTLAGALFAIRWQARENTKALTENAVSLFGYILEAQVSQLNEVMEWHTIDHNSVPKDPLLRLDGIIDIFDQEHNRLAYISRDGRAKIRDAVLDVKRWVVEVRTAQLELENARAGLGHIDVNLERIPEDEDRIEKSQRIVSRFLGMAEDLEVKSRTALSFLDEHGKK